MNRSANMRLTLLGLRTVGREVLILYSSWEHFYHVIREMLESSHHHFT